MYLLWLCKYQVLEILRYPNHNGNEDVIYMGCARGKICQVLKSTIFMVFSMYRYLGDIWFSDKI